jgi:S1-C subfamily serine protease
MKSALLKPLIGLVVFILAVGVACSAGSSPSPDVPSGTQVVEQPVKTTQPVQSEEPTLAPDKPAGLVSALQDAKGAVIQIEAQGTFIDPEFGLILNGAGRGSGFIIDPSGIAVTNNHVVTGAALLKVWVGGDTSKTYNAKVLGVSECSDLAVIDIDGEGFPYLEWYDDNPDVGMDIYVSGFPLGDPEYTLTKGVISKARADGETSWASVDSVIEFDANANPGNSGGPVLNPDGKVMGILYASNPSTDQSFGISQTIAKDIVQRLEAGEDINSIGVNGQAVGTDDGSLTGIWVSSVQSGSPADRAGILPGDILTSMENLVLATDGTMADYCDILRSHTPEDTLNLEVLRWTDGQMLAGQLNGRELDVVTVFEPDATSASTTPGSTSATVNPNASSSGDFFLATDFDDAENWYTFAVPESDDYDASLDNGTMYIEVGGENSTVYALYDMDLAPSDVRIDAGVETVAGPNRNNISVVCRATVDGWYEFSLNSGGYWYIWKYENGEYTQLANGASTAINLQKRKNEMIATCIGTDLSLYANGEELGSVSDNRFKGGGQVGVSVSTFDIAGAGVEFDWFTASVP